LGVGLTTPHQKRIIVTKPSDEPRIGAYRERKPTPGCNAKEEGEEDNYVKNVAPVNTTTLFKLWQR
jgi:hypothetical protein